MTKIEVGHLETVVGLVLSLMINYRVIKVKKYTIRFIQQTNVGLDKGWKGDKTKIVSPDQRRLI